MAFACGWKVRCALLALAFCLGTHAEGQKTGVQDTVAKRLERTRMAYEIEMDDIRAAVARAIEGELKKPGEPEAVEVLRLEAERFEREGAWPTLGGVKSWRNRAALAYDRLQQRYTEAITELERAGETEWARHVQTELLRLAQECDTVPWRVLAVSGDEAPETPLSSEFRTPVSATGAYHLDIAGVVTGDSGDELRLVLPLPGGAVGSVPIDRDDSGGFLARLAVRSESEVIDVLRLRPLELGAAEGSSTPSIRLIASAGTVSVTSLRVKPIVDGQPEVLPERRARQKDPAPREPESKRKKEDLSGVWQGVAFRKGDIDRPSVKAVIESANERSVVVRVYDDGNRSTYYTFKRDGSSIQLVGVKSRHATFRNFRTTEGTISEQKLRWVGTWTIRRNGDDASKDQSRVLDLSK